MYDYSAIEQYIDDILNDNDIISYVKRCIENDFNYIISIEENKSIIVPKDVEILIITKAFFKEYYHVSFGTFKILVSIGKIISGDENGLLQPEYCFATLYYNKNIELLDIDFHQEFR